VCGCTDETPCDLYVVSVVFDGSATFHQTTCGWTSPTRTVCTNPACVQAAQKSIRRLLTFVRKHERFVPKAWARR
jgi:hypothetical protein